MKSWSGPPTGKEPDVRIAARRNWPRSFPRSHRRAGQVNPSRFARASRNPAACAARAARTRTDPAARGLAGRSNSRQPDAPENESHVSDRCEPPCARDGRSGNKAGAGPKNSRIAHQPSVPPRPGRCRARSGASAPRRRKCRGPGKGPNRKSRRHSLHSNPWRAIPDGAPSTRRIGRRRSPPPACGRRWPGRIRCRAACRR